MRDINLFKQGISCFLLSQIELKCGQGESLLMIHSSPVLSYNIRS